MEEKENYNKKEIGEMFDSYVEYKRNYDILLFHEFSAPYEVIRNIKNAVNKQVENCEKNLPKSLINKLRIKKI